MTDRVLPTGTLTFLFSDMERSTRLVQDLGPATFTEVLVLHNTILREAFSRHGGVERGTQGDSFLVMFREAPAALSAAADAQLALDSAAWPGDDPVRVRMGLHTGIGTLGGDDYVGVDVNRAARIAGLAHGSQVLLSDATRALAEDGLARGLTIRPLGDVRLKDLTRPERIHQLVVDGLRSDFPRLRTEDRVVGNLPARMSSLVGREVVLAEVAVLLEHERLVTLTGPGGTGKTRLAIELARSQADKFDDGVWFVALDAIRQAEFVPSAIASSLGMVEAPGTTPVERLAARLVDRSMLLVLDNFEQVLGAAPIVAELVRASPGLKILVTSRAPLRLSMEQEYPVAPLAVPLMGGDADAALASDSVRLFVERAGRVRPGYTLSADDAPAVGEICRRLDGLPLGIELAASRVGLLPPRILAERLTRHLDVPGAGARDLPARQRTLEQTIAWSHDLLDEPSRRLLARLSVFNGGFRLEEADGVGRADGELGIDMIEGLTTLADHSLVQPMNGPDIPRFRLLETIRMFAAARLSEDGGADAVHRRHAAAYVALAEEAARHMPGRDQVPWLDRLSADQDNLRAAMVWAVETGDAEIAHRLLTASWRFWQFRGHIVEGRVRAEQVLAMPGGDDATTWRMRALEAAAGLEWWGGDIAKADGLYQSQLELARELGDEQGTADALFNLTHTRFSITPGSNGVAEIRAEAIALYQGLGDERSLARVAFSGAFLLMSQGKVDEADEVIRDCLTRFVRTEDEYYIALATGTLGGISLMKGDLDGAVRWGIQSLRSNYAMGDIASITLALSAAAALWFMAGFPGDAATIYAAYEGHGRRYGVRPPLDIAGWMGLDAAINGVRAVMAGDEFVGEVRRGAAMTTDEVVEFFTGEAQQRFLSRAG